MEKFMKIFNCCKTTNRRLCKWAAVFLIVGWGAVVVLAEEAWTAPPAAAQKENPVSADRFSLAAGKKLYALACAACHGDKGKGDGAAAAALTPKPKDFSDLKMQAQSDGALFWKISEGKTPMPPFGAALTDEQRWTLVNYLRTLAPKPAAASVNIKPADKP